jgi:hypothetical protein
VAIFGSKKDKKSGESSEQADRSIIVSDARIDRAGNEWKRKNLWVRQEHLGKLKVMAHFQDTKVEALLDKAVELYLRNNFDNSMALKQMIKKSTGKIPSVKI